MKLCCFDRAALVVLLLLLPTYARSALIGIFSIPDCTSCTLNIATGETKTIYISVTSIAGLPTWVEGTAGAVFRVTGFPVGWTAVVTPNALALVTFGDPFESGGISTSIPSGLFGDCQTLFTVDLTATSTVSDVRLRVEAKIPPMDIGLPCPVIIPHCNQCPFVLGLCVGGGELFINSQGECSVGIESSTWRQVKELFK